MLKDIEKVVKRKNEWKELMKVDECYNYFMGDQISSWQEGVKHNTIVLHNQKYV